MTNWKPTVWVIGLRIQVNACDISHIIEVMFRESLSSIAVGKHQLPCCTRFRFFHSARLLLDQSRRTCNKLISRSFLTILLIYSWSFYHLSVYIPFIRSLLKCHKFIGQHSFFLRFIAAKLCPFAVKAFCWALWLFGLTLLCRHFNSFYRATPQFHCAHASRHLLRQRNADRFLDEVDSTLPYFIFIWHCFRFGGRYVGVTNFLINSEMYEQKRTFQTFFYKALKLISFIIWNVFEDC